MRVADTHILRGQEEINSPSADVFSVRYLDHQYSELSRFAVPVGKQIP